MAESLLTANWFNASSVTTESPKTVPLLVSPADLRFVNEFTTAPVEAEDERAASKDVSN